MSFNDLERTTFEHPFEIGRDTMPCLPCEILHKTLLFIRIDDYRQRVAVNNTSVYCSP